MAKRLLQSDEELLNCLRRLHHATVEGLVGELGVTATAVRQRLTRLIEAGFVEREAITKGRGRPCHRYRLTELGQRSGGDNYADLAVSLWQEIRAIKDPEIRRGLLQRVATRLKDKYRHFVNGDEAGQRMRAVASLMNEREVLFDVDDSGSLPVLTAAACPYPDLAEQDRSICAMERMMFSEVVGEPLRLTQCRLDGENCCTFETSAASS